VTSRRTFVVITGGALLALSLDMWGQGQAAPRRIGFLSAFARSEIEALLSELRPELEKARVDRRPEHRAPGGAND